MPKKIAPKFRYFVRIGGFMDSPLYIRVDPKTDHAWLRLKGKYHEPLVGGYDLKFCLKSVRDGIWQELTEEEAQKLSEEDKKTRPDGQSPGQIVDKL